MQDDGLDMALKVLSHNINAAAHGIAICTSVDSQVCMYNSLGGKEDYPARFSDCNWIFMPINNGMEEQANEKPAKGGEGSHWALVGIDRVHKVIHYMDGMNKRDEDWLYLAHRVSSNMLHAIGEVPDPRWRVVEELCAPQQWMHNQFPQDRGPCAPYVYCMIDILAKYIISCRREGIEEHCRLTLDARFPAHFSNQFHSHWVRNLMQQSIWDWKKKLEAEVLARAHDEEATEGVAVEIVEEPLVMFEVPRALPRPAERSDAESESSMSTGPDETMNDDEEPALERAASPIEEVLSASGPGDQDEVVTLRCIGYDASVKDTAE